MHVFSHLKEGGAEILSTEISNRENSILLPDLTLIIPGDFNICVYTRITFDPNQKSVSKTEFFGFENPTDINFKAIHLEMKENIHFNQHQISLYASQSSSPSCQIFLLPRQLQPPNKFLNMS